MSLWIRHVTLMTLNEPCFIVDSEWVLSLWMSHVTHSWMWMNHVTLNESYKSRWVMSHCHIVDPVSWGFPGEKSAEEVSCEFSRIRRGNIQYSKSTAKWPEERHGRDHRKKHLDLQEVRTLGSTRTGKLTACEQQQLLRINVFLSMASPPPLPRHFCCWFLKIAGSPESTRDLLLRLIFRRGYPTRWMGQVTYSEWVKSPWMIHVTHTWLRMSHVTYFNTKVTQSEWIISHSLENSYHSEWVMSHIADLEWVTSHIWMSHIWIPTSHSLIESYHDLWLSHFTQNGSFHT